MDEHRAVYPHNGIVLIHKKEEHSGTRTSVDGAEDIMPREINQSQKDKGHVLHDSTHTRDLEGRGWVPGAEEGDQGVTV